MDYLEITYELKSLIEKDERYIRLKEKEKMMEESDEVMALSYQKDLKETALSDLLKYYSKDSTEVRKAQVELFRISTKLDEHPLVKEYLKAYQELESLLKEVNNILFGDFKRKKCL